jgi:S1-C subfamily serine protease
MKLFIKSCFAVTLFTSFHLICSAQSFSIKPESVGTIADSKTGESVGTGFIVGSARTIVTCAHVISDREYSYEPVRNQPPTPRIKKSFPVKLLYALPRYDLAVLQASEDVTEKPLELGDFRRLRPGDRVIYIGWVAGTNNLKVDVATVSATGAVLNDNAIVEFLEFEGVGKPGYSGGPVFDINGNIVAIMREAWTKKGVKGGGEFLINRAFSTDILSVLMKQVFVRGD